MVKKKGVFMLSMLLFSALALTSCAGKKANNTVYLDEPVEVAPVSSADTKLIEDFSKQDVVGIGKMAYMPFGASDRSAICGTNAFKFFFNNPNVTPGNGVIRFFTSDGTSFDSVDFSKEEERAKAKVEALSDEGKALTGFTVGTEITVYLKKPYERSVSYYVLMDRGAFKTPAVLSKEVLTPGMVAFTTTSYGIGNIVRPAAIHAQDSIYFDVYTSSKITKVVVKNLSIDSLELSETQFTRDGTLKATFKSTGERSLRLYFYDNSGLEVASIPMTFEVVPK